MPDASYPRRRYLAVLLALVLVLAGTAVYRLLSPTQSGTDSFEELLQADLSMKMFYAAGSYTPARERSTMAGLGDVRDRAAGIYRRVFLRDPSLRVARRLVIIEPQAGKASAIALYGKLKSKDAPAEKLMWERIYTSKSTISDPVARGYNARIRHMNLGWYQDIALSDLYTKAGDKAAAARFAAAAQTSARDVTAGLVLLFLVMLFLFLAGLVAIIWYLAAGHVPQSSAVPEDARSLVSGRLLEAFLLSILINISLDLVLWGVADLHLFSGSLAAVLLMCIQYVLWGVLSVYALVWRLKGTGVTLSQLGLRSVNVQRDILWGIGGYAASLPMLAITGLIAQYLNRYVQTPSNPVVPLFASTNTALEKFLLFVLVAVAAPFFEEILFRGALFTSFRLRWSLAASVLASAAIFASVHPLPLGFLPILVLGSVFAVIFYRRGSLLTSMVSHALNNAVAFIILLLVAGS